MRIGLKTSWKLILMGTVAAAALTAAPLVTLTPSGALSGPPGATVGWGFSLTNDVNWIEVVQSQFCLDSPLGNPCFNASSQYFDIISNPPNDVIVGPGGTVSQIFDPLSNLGMGSFSIAPGASIGSVILGNILVTYNTFDADPNLGGNQIGFNDAISAAASVSVASATTVPEPATFEFFGIALVAIIIRLAQAGRFP